MSKPVVRVTLHQRISDLCVFDLRDGSVTVRVNHDSPERVSRLMRASELDAVEQEIRKEEKDIVFDRLCDWLDSSVGRGGSAGEAEKYKAWLRSMQEAM